MTACDCDTGSDVGCDARLSCCQTPVGTLLTLPSGFEPYFYAKVPESFKEEQCEGFRKNLNELMSQQQRGGNRGDNSTFISAVTLVRDKQSLMYYQEGRTALFVRVTTTLPAMVGRGGGFRAWGANRRV